MTGPPVDASLDALALVKAALHDDRAGFDLILTATDDPHHLRWVAAVLAHRLARHLHRSHPEVADRGLAILRDHYLARLEGDTTE